MSAEMDVLAGIGGVAIAGAGYILTLPPPLGEEYNSAIQKATDDDPTQRKTVIFRGRIIKGLGVIGLGLCTGFALSSLKTDMIWLLFGSICSAAVTAIGARMEWSWRLAVTRIHEAAELAEVYIQMPQ